MMFAEFSSVSSSQLRWRSRLRPPTLQRLIRRRRTLPGRSLHLGHEAGFPVGTLLPVAAVAAGVVYLVKKADEAQVAVAC